MSADVESTLPASEPSARQPGRRQPGVPVEPTEQPAASTGTAPVVVDHVTKTYRVRGRGHGQVVAVDDVSFTIEPGAAVSLVGASGSGKSTIAKMITGLERPTSGSITIGDVAVHRLRGRRLRDYHRRVQMVFQDPYGALNPLHTVEYTLTRPLQNFLGMSARQSRQRVAELLETVGLIPPAQFAAKLPHQLSGGQRQRVVIARALACEPEVMVADEPASMLDVSLRAGVLHLLSRLRAERGLSLLYITHDLLSARVVTDDILVLNHGRIVERGTTKEVLQHPKDEYTVKLLDAIANPQAIEPSTDGASSGGGAAPTDPNAGATAGPDTTAKGRDAGTTASSSAPPADPNASTATGGDAAPTSPSLDTRTEQD